MANIGNICTPLQLFEPRGNESKIALDNINSTNAIIISAHPYLDDSKAMLKRNNYVINLFALQLCSRSCFNHNEADVIRFSSAGRSL